MIARSDEREAVGRAAADGRRGPAVLLPRHVRRAVIAHAIRDAPRECCGLLVGRGRTIAAAVPTLNLENSSTRFRVNEREHFRLRRAVRLVSPPLEVVGVYHSHPGGPARPSPRDVAESHYPDWVYLVVGTSGVGRPRVRGFAIRDGCARPQRLSIQEPVARVTNESSSNPARTD